MRSACGTCGAALAGFVGARGVFARSALLGMFRGESVRGVELRWPVQVAPKACSGPGCPRRGGRGGRLAGASGDEAIVEIYHNDSAGA